MTKRREGHTLVALWLPGEPGGGGGGDACGHINSANPKSRQARMKIFLLIDACHKNTDSLLFGFP